MALVESRKFSILRALHIELEMLMLALNVQLEHKKNLTGYS